MLFTTLDLLQTRPATCLGIEKVKYYVGSEYPTSREISLETLLASNDLSYAVLAMQVTTVDCKQQIAQMAVDFAKTSLSVFEQVLPEDKRPRLALNAASAFMQDNISFGKLLLALQDAENAAWSVKTTQEVRKPFAEAKAREVIAAAWAVHHAVEAVVKMHAPHKRLTSALAASWAAAWASAAGCSKDHKDIFLKYVSSPTSKP